jgi:hypothetical protein
MTKWATGILRHRICLRIESITTRSPVPRENGHTTPLHGAPLSPSASTNGRGQGGDQQPNAPKTPLPNGKSTHDLSSDLQTLNTGPARNPLSDDDRQCVVRDMPAHVLSSSVRSQNKANEAAVSAPRCDYPIAIPRNIWEKIVPIHTPFSSIPIREKIRKPTSAAKACDLVSSVSEKLPSQKLPSAPMDSATKKAERPCHPTSSPNLHKFVQPTTNGESFVKMDRRTSESSANEPSSHVQGSGAMPILQEANAPTTSTDLDSDPDNDNTSSPSSRRGGERQASPDEEKQNLPRKSESVAWTAGRPDLLESRGCRYHDYTIRRKVMWSWTSVMFGRLGARAEDADGSICSEDTSDSEYVPSELCDTEWEDDSEAASHWAREEVWESQSEDSSFRTRQVESDGQSECGVSEYHDDGEQDESGNESSEYWETEDEGDEMQNDSEYGSSDLWDDEADCHTVPDSSEGEQSHCEDHADPGTGGSAHTGDEDDRISTETGRGSRRRHPQRGSLLKGADLERLRSMALSTLRGVDFAELPLMQSTIQAIPEGDVKTLNVALWCHHKFDPSPSEIRNTVVRDLNRCSALDRGEDHDTSRVDTVDSTFEELRCSPFKERLSLWFADEDGDVDFQRRICMNLIRLTKAPYCARVLRYVGLEDSCEFWDRLGEEALGYIYDCKYTS